MSGSMPKSRIGLLVPGFQNESGDSASEQFQHEICHRLMVYWPE